MELESGSSNLSPKAQIDFELVIKARRLSR